MEVPPNKSTSYFNKIKKYLPFVFLFFLTVTLMLFFRHNKRNFSRMLEEGTTNLLSLAKNLKPLLFQTEITNEDVFNFALFQSLPLDKEKNKILLISTSEPGNNVYEIKSASYKAATNNYDTFTKYLGLNDSQKEKADSILNSYKKEIYASVLVRNDVFAVNPKLVDLQQAVLADIVAFAQKVNAEKSHQLFSQKFRFYDNKKVTHLIASAKEIPQNEYLLITPDTVAKTHFKWNEENFDKYLVDLEKAKEYDRQKMEENDHYYQFKITPERKKNSNGGESDYSYKIDANLSRVVLPAVELEHIDKMIQDTLRIKLKEAARKIRSISIPYVGDIEHQRKKTSKQKIPGVNSYKIVDPYEIASKAMEILSRQNLGELIELGMKMDAAQKSGTDSLKMVKMKEAMKKMEKKLQKLKEMKIDTTEIGGN